MCKYFPQKLNNTLSFWCCQTHYGIGSSHRKLDYFFGCFWCFWWVKPVVNQSFWITGCLPIYAWPCLRNANETPQAMRRRIFRRPSNWIPRTKCGAWQMEGTEKSRLMWIKSGWWFQTFFHNIWDNPSHWLVFFRGIETTNQKWLVNRLQFMVVVNIECHYSIALKYVHRHVVNRCKIDL